MKKFNGFVTNLKVGDMFDHNPLFECDMNITYKVLKVHPPKELTIQVDAINIDTHKEKTFNFGLKVSL